MLLRPKLGPKVEAHIFKPSASSFHVHNRSNCSVHRSNLSVSKPSPDASMNGFVDTSTAFREWKNTISETVSLSEVKVCYRPNGAFPFAFLGVRGFEQG